MSVPLLLGVTGLIVLTGGITSLVEAVRRFRRERRGAVGYSAATGRVIERYLPQASSQQVSSPSYTIDFTAADGNVVRFITDSVGWGPRPVGASVQVLYNPATPDDAFVRGAMRVAAYLFAVAGVIFTLVGLLMALSALDLAQQSSSAKPKGVSGREAPRAGMNAV